MFEEPTRAYDRAKDLTTMGCLVEPHSHGLIAKNHVNPSNCSVLKLALILKLLRPQGTIVCPCLSHFVPTRPRSFLSRDTAVGGSDPSNKNTKTSVRTLNLNPVEALFIHSKPSCHTGLLCSVLSFWFLFERMWQCCQYGKHKTLLWTLALWSGKMIEKTRENNIMHKLCNTRGGWDVRILQDGSSSTSHACFSVKLSVSRSEWRNRDRTTRHALFPFLALEANLIVQIGPSTNFLQFYNQDSRCWECCSVLWGNLMAMTWKRSFPFNSLRIL